MNTINRKAAALMTALSVGAAAASGGNGVGIEHLGTNNTLVRVTDKNARYLLMPVQESNDDATVNVIVDGRLDRTVYVRLAKSKIDYTVPLDIERYKGHDVVLNIVTSPSRTPAGTTSACPTPSTPRTASASAQHITTRPSTAG